MPVSKKPKRAKNAPKIQPKRNIKTVSNLYQVKVVLMNVEPPIWRRFVVPDSITLHQLHAALQIVMGWEDSHLHQFVLGADVYADPDSEPDGEMGEMIDEHQISLGEVLPKESTAITYEYDFGDRWKHLVLVERIFDPSEMDVEPLTCLEGERACPPEDCGGVHGYGEVLDIIFNPQHPDYEAMLNWTGKDFNPEVYDLETVNLLLKDLRKSLL